MDPDLIICIWIPRFALESSARSRLLEAEPDAIYEAESTGQPLLAVRAQLEAGGVRPGLLLREVQTRWPTLRLRAYQYEQASAAFESVLRILDSFSPFVESSTAGHAYLDASGLERQYGSRDQLAQRIRKAVQIGSTYSAQVGVGSSKFVADVAARAAAVNGVWVVPPGQEIQTMAPLPLEVLGLEPDTIKRLHALGICNAGAFAALPNSSIRHRFGSVGLRVHCGLHGRLQEPLQARSYPLVLHDHLDLEWVEDNPDRLQFACKMLVDRLSMQLVRHGVACRALEVCWRFEDQSHYERTLRLAEPTARSSILLRHIRWHLDGLQTPQGVTGIRLRAAEVYPDGGQQLKLLSGAEARIPDVERRRRARNALGRLQARWGDEMVRQAELTSERRPEQSFRWRDATLPELELDPADSVCHLHPPFLLHDPPWPIRVRHLRDGHQVVLLDGHRYVVDRQSGPWRLHDRAWAVDAAARDYYQFETEHGPSFLCFRDRGNTCWYLQGRYA